MVSCFSCAWSIGPPSPTLAGPSEPDLHHPAPGTLRSPPGHPHAPGAPAKTTRFWVNLEFPASICALSTLTQGCSLGELCQVLSSLISREESEKLMKLQSQRGGQIFLEEVKKLGHDD